jgi:hypothetical protein
MATEPQPIDQDRTRLEQFATLYALGTPIPEALKEAGFTTKSLSLGYRLLHDPLVIEIVDQTRQWAAEKLALSVNSVIEQLQRDRDFAYALSNPGAAIQASSMIARIIGALEPSSRTPAKITIEWGGSDTEGEIPQ